MDLGDRVIDGDAAQVYLYQLEVHAQGNISLTDKPTGIHFDCDSVEVKGNERHGLCKWQHGFYPG